MILKRSRRILALEDTITAFNGEEILVLGGIFVINQLTVDVGARFYEKITHVPQHVEGVGYYYHNAIISGSVIFVLP